MHLRNQTSVTEFLLLGLTSDAKTQVLLFLLFLVIYLITLTGNFLIITVVYIDSQLQTPMYFFLSNLSFLDMCYTTIIVPKMLVNFLSQEKTISFVGCAAQILASLFLGETECILLAVMAWDRYMAICNPLYYNVIMNKKTCYYMAAGAWVCGLAISVVDVVFTFHVSFCGPNTINHFFCEVPALLRLACTDTYVNEVVIFVVCVITLVVPFSLILFTYVYIIVIVVHIPSTTRQNRTFSTCTSHLMVVMLFYGTAIFMYMRPRESYSPEKDKMISVFYTVITPMLNPIIYSLRNNDVKRALRKVSPIKSVSSTPCLLILFLHI
ncbi:olfactory receptor 2D2-like [Microcaecilia unicolor]|uniref:Olfactory receptor n=1 Tax=Microcaecilia unicolor TaxID=1415580 RepID=A0A6P7YPJ5_9AMPH|nr:olfactory receptor 2D2-like [Microcaecilia unicolor]